MRRDPRFAFVLAALLLAALALAACKPSASTTEETQQPASPGGTPAASEGEGPAGTAAPTATPQPTATATPSPSPTAGPDLATLLQTPAAMYTAADLDAAHAAYEELSTLYPDQAEPWLGLASLAIRNGDEPGALELVRSAATAEPASFEAWQQMAVLLEHARAYDQAAEAYAQMIALVPDDPDLYVSRALIAARLGDGDQAVADMTQAQALDPYREYAWLNVAGAAFDGRHYDAAAAIAAAGLESYPESPELYVLQGEAHLASGDAEAALTALDAATAANPQSALALRWRAEALDALGRTDEAAEAFQQAGDLGVETGGSGRTEGLEAMARAAQLIARTDPDTAFAYLQEKSVRFGQPLEILWGYALIDLERGDTGNALNRLNSLVDNFGYTPASFDRGMLHASEGRADQAIDDLQAYLSTHSAGPKAEAARAQLEELGADPDAPGA